MLRASLVFPVFVVFFNMRFDTAFTALVSSATLMGYAHAEEAEAVPDAASAVAKPTFTVCLPIFHCPTQLLLNSCNFPN